MMRRPGNPVRAPDSVARTSMGWWAKSSTTMIPRSVPRTVKRRCTPWNAASASRVASNGISRKSATASVASELRTLWRPGIPSVTVPISS